MKKICFNDKFGLTAAVLQGSKTMTRKIENGDRFGKLTVIGVDHKGDDRKWYYKCQCDCGNTTIVRSNALTSGNTQSCGCQKGHRDSHHKSKTRLYGIWIGMRDRCNNIKNNAYDRYGGRGIIVCDEWQDNYLEFEKWALSNGYADNLSIDRINVNGNYSPSNCRWATAQEQADNKRSNILITIGKKTHNLQQWCDIYSINRSTVNTRVRTCGWSYKKAITTPIRKHKQYKKRNGSTQKTISRPGNDETCRQIRQRRHRLCSSGFANIQRF